MGSEFEPLSEEEAKAHIEELEGLDTESNSIDKISEKVAVQNIRNPGLLLSEGTTFYRARKMKNKPSKISELNYPPEELVGVQRANRPNDPVFYACSGAGGAVFELDPSPGDKIAIAKWEATEKLMINKVGYSKEVIRNSDSNRDPDAIIGDDYLDEESDGNSIIREYLAKLFTQRVPEEQKHKHKLTAAIAEFFRSEGTIDGLVYPAVKSSKNYDNFALETDTVDNALSPISAEYIEFHGRDGQEGSAEIIDTCINIDGNGIHWNGHGRKSEINGGELCVFINEEGQLEFPDEVPKGVNHLFDPDFEY